MLIVFYMVYVNLNTIKAPYHDYDLIKLLVGFLTGARLKTPLKDNSGNQSILTMKR